MKQTIYLQRLNLAVVEVCHHHGWIQSGISLEKVCYMFSLPLHATYVSWKLIPSIVECPFMPTQDMTLPSSRNSPLLRILGYLE